MAEHDAEPLEAVLRRLKKERDEADARYNDALTAVDRALHAPPEIPQPPPALDDQQIAALNEAWNIIPSPPSAAGFRQRAAGFVWGIVGPYLQRQLSFNALVIDHVNRNAAAARHSHRVAEQTADALRDQLAALAQFETRLLQYLQQITAYVDTKDRDTAGGALVLNASLSGLADSVAKRWESMSVREQRVSARMDALATAHDDLRSTIGTVQQGLMTIKREMERVATTPSPASDRAPEPAASRTVDPGSRQVASPDAFARPLDAYKYVGFEDQFRGSRDAIRQRLESYVPLVDGKQPVLDVGCGRGEFLDLLTSRGIEAHGIDLNHAMAEACRARGLDVTEADAVGYLSTLADASLGAIFSAQVVEHLEPSYLLRFLELAFHKLRPGGRVLLETLNPACWVAFFDSYIRDITHVWPLHPDTLKYLVVASGFSGARVEFRSPVREEDKLQPFAAPTASALPLADLAEAFNANVEKLNARMFTYLDYAVIGDKAS
ncbi:MAG: class I SAM-dependent methyltransferase [Vicinamibacterales bacterium]